MNDAVDDRVAEGRFRIAFFFNAQLHQLLHGITTAIELSRDPGFDVHVIGGSPAHLDYARRVIGRAGGAALTLALAGGTRDAAHARPHKLVRLAVAARQLAGFDAIALPERTSILLKRLGVTAPLYIHLDHGAGDRAVGFDPRIRLFDFVLLAGAKTHARMLREGFVRPGAHAVIGYPKFDAAALMRDGDWSPFAERRPIVLYNPHFGALGSWRACGRRVLAAFAAQDRYNLVFAPHMRLFDQPGARAMAEADLAAFTGCGHIHVDLGSDRSVDMTYTMLADIYLGDVSSQIYEFLAEPRPCLFLNAGGVAWEGDENYAHWRFGPVLDGAVADDPLRMMAAVDAAVTRHAGFRAEQQSGVAATFGLSGECSSTRAARAIATFVRHGAVDRAAETGAAAAPPPPSRRAPRRDGAWPMRRPSRRFATQAAFALLLAGGGWLAGTGLTPASASETIVDEALESDDATMLRSGMRSQVETPALDAAEIAAKAAIHLPPLPADWRVTDVQIYPSDNGPGVQIAIRSPAGDPVTLLALRDDGTLRKIGDAAPRIARQGAQTVAWWHRHGLSIALVARMPGERLRPLALRLAGAPG